MHIQNCVDSIRRGLRRPEVRAHPFRAMSRRWEWRQHWRKAGAKPIVLDPWWRDVRIALPHTNNASLLYFRTHSDPTMVWLLQVLLAPGMTFVDIGAHIGEFTLVGARMVGSEGRAVALEPLGPCVEAIRHNATLNSMTQVTVHEGALAEKSGKIGFSADPGRTAGWIAHEPAQAAFETSCWSLDEFLTRAGCPHAHVIKLDASGNELSVLRGGEKSLRERAIGALIMKLYNPAVTRERFGYDAHQSVALLRDWGLKLKLIAHQEAFPVSQPEDIDVHYDRLTYCHLLMAQPVTWGATSPSKSL